jgi:translocator protein
MATMGRMTVASSHRSALTDLVRSSVVVLAAVVQVVVAILAGGGVVGEPMAEMARRFATPLVPADWTYAIWVPIYAGFLLYAGYQFLPSQRGREVHRETGWWLVASAAFNVAWVLAAGGGLVPLVEMTVIALLVSLSIVFGRLTNVPAETVAERVVLRGTVAVYTGWVSLAVVIGTATSGAWIGLPSSGSLAAIAAVVVLLAVIAIVCWVVLSGTAVVGFAAAAVWALAGIALNNPPAAVVVTGAIAIVAVLAATTRRLTAAGNPLRAGFG